MKQKVISAYNILSKCFWVLLQIYNKQNVISLSFIQIKLFSVIHIHVSILFPFFSPIRLLHSIEHSCLWMFCFLFLFLFIYFLILATFIQHSIGSHSHNSQMRKRNKRNPNWKGRNKLSLFADDLILYIENPKDATKNL